jgi:hypothetical protein
VLFFGNSHVAAYKLAYDRLAGASPYACDFYCALGLDPAFTEVRGLSLVATERAVFEQDELLFFCADGAVAEQQRYLREGAPSRDVARQFLMTGGSETIDLSEVSEIFYVAGSSPYDFRRLGEYIRPVTDSLRDQLLARLLRDRFLLRRQVAAIRKAAPHVRHHFVGAPLRRWQPVTLSPEIKDILERNRAATARLAGNYLFDEVFMPGPSVLAEDLVSTRPEFFSRGNQQAQAYLGVSPTREDILHVNADYADVVFEEFVTPLAMQPRAA